MSGIIKPPFGAQLNREHPLASGLIGCWLFNSGSGNRAHDDSGNWNTGTLTNMADPPTATSGWNGGKYGGSIAFDGSNDYISCGNIGAGQSKITLVAWINPTSITPAAQQTIMSKGDNAVLQLEYNLNLETDGRIRFWTSTGGVANTGRIVFSGASISAGCTCVVATYDGVNATVYLNGGAGNSLASTGTIFNGSKSVLIGSFDTTNVFNGRIDACMLYAGRALAADEVSYISAFPFCMFDEPDYRAWMLHSGLSIPVAYHHYAAMRAAA